MLNSVETVSENSITAKLEGKLVAGSIDEFRERLKELIKNGPNTVILDLSDVNFIDSTGIGFWLLPTILCQKPEELSKSLVFQRKSMTFSSVCG